MGFVEYIKETKTEMKLVKWPTRNQVLVLTAVVVVISIAVALLLGAFDFGFARIVAKFA